MALAVGLLRNPFRRRRLTRFYKPFINPGDLCFDIGAHVGNLLVYGAALGPPRSPLNPNQK